MNDYKTDKYIFRTERGFPRCRCLVYVGEVHVYTLMGLTRARAKRKAVRYVNRWFSNKE